MLISPIKTHRVEIGETLAGFLDAHVTSLSEKSILVLTSKVLSIIQGRIRDKQSISKYELICQEADQILETEHNPYDLYLTIKNNILIPSAGIDESNAKDCYILFPEKIQETAAWMWDYLRNKFHIQELGILITDSHTTIMRQGVTGIALGWCGFKPLYSYVNKPDLYGHPLRVTQVNILDSLATAAVFVMGEGDEQTPLVMIQEAPKMTFVDHPPTMDEENSVVISMEKDLYGPLLHSGRWLRC